jgi:hypothetical protein
MVSTGLFDLKYTVQFDSEAYGEYMTSVTKA